MTQMPAANNQRGLGLVSQPWCRHIPLDVYSQRCLPAQACWCRLEQLASCGGFQVQQCPLSAQIGACSARECCFLSWPAAHSNGGKMSTACDASAQAEARCFLSDLFINTSTAKERTRKKERTTTVAPKPHPAHAGALPPLKTCSQTSRRTVCATPGGSSPPTATAAAWSRRVCVFWFFVSFFARGGQGAYPGSLLDAPAAGLLRCLS